MRPFFTIILIAGIITFFYADVFVFDDEDWQYRNKISLKPLTSLTFPNKVD